MLIFLKKSYYYKFYDNTSQSQFFQFYTKIIVTYIYIYKMLNSGTSKIQQHKTLIAYSNPITSPIEIDDQIHCICENGDIIKINSKSQPEVLFTILGHPSCLSYRAISNTFLVADFAHESIFERENQENQQIRNLISEFSDHAFHGPNNIKIGYRSNNMYFTDSGPFFETSIENCRGSLYLYDFQEKMLRALAHRNLAYPTGLQMDQQERFILVCEMGKNRILKFHLDEKFSGNYSVFYQFSGRVGPSAISFCEQLYYVTLFEFNNLCDNGMIALLNKAGELIQKITVPFGPELTGIFMLSSLSSSGGSMCLISQKNNLHKISFKGDRTQSRQQSSLMLQKK